MSEKLKPNHLDRAAYVYVRQSTMYQVRNNQESQRRQYGLEQRARDLGFREVVVIDDDLGISGSGVRERPGFGRLLAAVCAGKVGAVLAIEASRLARNNRDWYHLLDLCTLTETLVIDHDGICDPRLINDRLLLGLKGTMSEFELSLLRQRSQEALRQMVRRGEVIFMLPVGYTRTEDNRCEMTPDRQIQDAIKSVFSKFRELGSARQVLLWFRQEQIPLPHAVPDSMGRQVVWRLPIYHSFISLLRNPVYAGAFAYGRTGSKTSIIDGVARKTQGHRIPQAAWQVLIKDHHPGYISWDEYERNQNTLESNSGMNGRLKAGAPKSGPALLAGLLRCGRCGRKLHVGYSGNGGRVPRYYCRGAHLNHGTKWCLSFGGLRPDEAITAVILEALQPVGIEAALAANRTASQHDNEKRRSLRLSLEKARYEADRIERQFNAVEPENRLVAGELERRWNEALARVTEIENRLASEQAAHQELTASDQKRLYELGSDLKLVWDHPDASVQLKKRILRTVLEEIVVDITADPPVIQMRLHWKGGVHTLLRVPKNKSGQHRYAADREVVEVVRELAKICDDPALAGLLNRLGYRTGTEKTWTASRVYGLRTHHNIPRFDPEARHAWLTMDETAAELKVSETVIRRMVKQGVLPARQVVPYAPWIIQRVDIQRKEVQTVIQAVKAGQRLPSTVPGQNLISFTETT